MKNKHFIIFFISLSLFFSTKSISQSTLEYSMVLEPMQINGFVGLHSFAFAQHSGKWLLIGGRKDGLHARQPFNAFPASQNNKNIYVVDPVTNQTWTTNIDVLPVTIAEQLQSTNMNFIQSNDTLYFVGGYAFSATANDHITFPNLTTINVPGLINAIINQMPITGNFKQTTDTLFQVTGGRLGKIEDKFYLVGGHKFMGRYNPMGNPTYVQHYTNQVRIFNINNSNAIPQISNIEAWENQLHLHRRDYNLIPQIFPDGEFGYTISSGVFQPNINLPFLYPVDIKANGYSEINGFNQYLSNYHGAFLSIYHEQSNKMQTLFFGGISKFYYQNGILQEDELVPFVQSISMLQRASDNSLSEHILDITMPSYEGASADFIPNLIEPFIHNEILNFQSTTQDTIIAGYIVGGIKSNLQNPFSNNQTGQTIASSNIYKVKLIKNNPTKIYSIDGKFNFDFSVNPNPADDFIQINFTLNNPSDARLYLIDEQGRIFKTEIIKGNSGKNEWKTNISSFAGKLLFAHLIIDKYKTATKKILIKRME